MRGTQARKLNVELLALGGHHEAPEQLIRSDIATWWSVVKDAGIKNE